MSDYQPIPCALHSEYELWIMRQQRLHVCWQDEDGGHHEGVLIPKDIYTRAAEEFLVLEDRTGERRELRLDRILSAVPSN